MAKTSSVNKNEARKLAMSLFADHGVEKHWHKRIVRSGPNSITIAGDNPPDRAIEADDIVYVDLGPVFEAWEADIGKSYVLGDDPKYVKDSPRTATNTAAGGILGVLVGLLIVIALETAQASVLRSNADIERKLTLPLMGSIPSH